MDTIVEAAGVPIMVSIKKNRGYDQDQYRKELVASDRKALASYIPFLVIGVILTSVGGISFVLTIIFRLIPGIVSGIAGLVVGIVFIAVGMRRRDKALGYVNKQWDADRAHMALTAWGWICIFSTLFTLPLFVYGIPFIQLGVGISLLVAARRQFKAAITESDRARGISDAGPKPLFKKRNDKSLLP